MKTLFKILIPLFFVFSAKSQVTNIQGSTINMSGFGANAANLTMKLPTSYRTGSYLQIGIGNVVNWNYAIDSAWYLGGVLSLRRASHDTLTLAISGGGSGVSSVAAGFGMNFSTITTSGSVAADSFTLATRLRVKKQIDSLAALIGTGGVTSVAAGFGTVFSTIISTGSVIIDSFTIATRLRVKKQIDSLSALLSSYVPIARTLTHSSGFGTIVTGGTQDLSSNRTWSYLTDSTSGGLLSWVRGKKIADSLGVIIATKGVGSVTSVAAGYGLNFTTITGSGSVISDTFAMATRARVQKPIDSLDAAIVAGYVPITRTVAGFALSSNVTLASLTIGSGLSGTTSTYNGSTAVTISAGDLSATYWALNGNVIIAGSQSGSFLGAINNVSLRFRSNNIEVAKLDSTGSQFYLENGLNPLVSLKQATSAQEFLLRVGLNTGLSNSNLNIYNATASKVMMYFSDYRHVAFGNVTSIPSASQIYGFGGANGANLDMRPDSTVYDESNIEVEGSDYDGSSFTGYGVAMQFDGNAAPNIGLLGYSIKNAGQLRFQGKLNVIKVTPNASLRFATNSTEYMVLDSNGRVGIGNKLPTYTLDVTGTSRITSTFYLSGNTYNSGAALVALAIDTLTGIVYRKTAASSGVTSVASGFGTSFSTITSTGTVVADSTSGGLLSWVRGLKIKDSLVAWSNTTFVPLTRTVAGFALSSNVTLASHTVGFGLSGSAYNGSSAIAWTADSTSGGLLSWVRGKKIIDSLGVVIATKGTGTVTSVASGFGTSFSTITTTGTIVGDSTSGGLLSWVRGKKIIDSLAAIINTKGSGTVTSVAAGFGHTFSTITSTGTIVSDTTSGGVLSWVRGKKIIDSLAAIIATKGSGTVTSVGSGFGTNFSAITSTGNVVVDTTSGGILSWVRGKKLMDSLSAINVTLTGSQTLTNKIGTSSTNTWFTETDNNLTYGTNVLGTNKTIQSLTDGATITWDASLGYNSTVTLGGNRTLAITNPQQGDFYTITVKQDGTGGRTLTLPGGTTALISTVASDSTTLVGFYRNSAYEWRSPYTVSTNGQTTMSWVSITATTKTMVAGEGYISTSDNTTRLVYTLPVSPVIGQIFAVIGAGGGGWKIAQNASQVIKQSGNSTTSGVTGYIQSGTQYDAVRLIYVATNTFAILAVQGTLTLN